MKQVADGWMPTDRQIPLQVGAVILATRVRSPSCTRRKLCVLADERTGVGRLTADRAVHPRLESRAAAVLIDGWEHSTGHVPVTPLFERHNHGQQVAAGAREPVLVAWRAAGVLGPFDHTHVLQSAQPRGEDVAWGPGVGGDLAEPLYAEEQFADHEQ